MHSFPVRTPICHIVPISRIYGGGGGICVNDLSFAFSLVLTRIAATSKFGDQKSLSIKNHPKPFQEFSEQIGPSMHKMKGFCKNSPPKFTRTWPKTWEDKFLGIPSGLKKSQIARDCNRNSKKSLQLRKHPLRPTPWTRDPPVLHGLYSVSEASHRAGNPPEIVATTRV